MANQYTGLPQQSTLERLVMGSTINGTCMLWGNKDKNGYGSIAVKSKSTNRYVTNLVHRVSYTLFIGKIPEGFVIDHTCGVRNCINPGHLEAVTQKENDRRAEKSITTINS